LWYILHDSTIAKGKEVPVKKLRAGKNINLMKRNKNTIENTHPFRESSFHNKNQNFFQASFKFMKRKKKKVFLNGLVWRRIND